jgi:hypothetical protein
MPPIYVIGIDRQSNAYIVYILVKQQLGHTTDDVLYVKKRSYLMEVWI